MVCRGRAAFKFVNARCKWVVHGTLSIINWLRDDIELFRSVCFIVRNSHECMSLLN